MLQYVLAGLALGSIYAIAASALVVTFVSSGVLNFAFGSMAFVVARFYYWLNSQHHMSTIGAGLLSILVLAPLMGILLYAVLFRFVRGKSTLIKLVTTIGLSVALPPICDLIFGTQTITSAPGLGSLNDKPYKFLGAAVTTDQVLIYGFLLLILIAGTLVLQFTDIGLRVRAMVDSEAMTSLSGTSPNRVSVGVWAVSATLAGLAGVLVAPANGLSPTGMTTLMAAAFAAVVVARLRSLPGAVAAALAMGIVTDVIQKYLPPNSSFTAAIIPSIPFAFIAVALIVQSIGSRTIDESAGVGGPLDKAIRPANIDTEDATASTEAQTLWERGLSLLPLAAVAVLPLIFSGSAYWLGLTALGMCYGITFLTFTLVTGEGGMLWLSQIIFAGVGALGAPQFATSWHIPILLAIVVAARGRRDRRRDHRPAHDPARRPVRRAGDADLRAPGRDARLHPRALPARRPRRHRQPADLRDQAIWLSPTWRSACSCIFAILTWNLRRSTSGLALRAVRDSPSASRTLGLSVVQVKILVSALGAFTAAIGGGFLAMDDADGPADVVCHFPRPGLARGGGHAGRALGDGRGARRDGVHAVPGCPADLRAGSLGRASSDPVRPRRHRRGAQSRRRRPAHRQAGARAARQDPAQRRWSRQAVRRWRWMRCGSTAP